MMLVIKQPLAPVLYIRRKKDAPTSLQGVELDRLVNSPTLRYELDGENANTSAELDNSDGYFTRIWSDSPPIRSEATLINDDNSDFNGVIVSIELGQLAIVSIES